MSKHIRFTALLLAVSLLLNMAALPATAEGSVDSAPSQQENSALESGISDIPASSEENTVLMSSTPESSASPAEDSAYLSADGDADNAVTSQNDTPAGSDTEISDDGNSNVSDSSSDTENTGSLENADQANSSSDEADVSHEGASETGAADNITEANDAVENYPTGTVECQTSVNIRSGPGTSFSIEGSAANGQKVTIYETCVTEEYSWGRIDPERQLWICLDYVRMDPPVDNSGNDDTPTEGSEVTDPPTEGGEVTDTPTEGGEMTNPPTEGGENTDPPTEGGEMTDPPTEGGENTDTPTEGGEVTDTPTEGGEVTDTPTEGDGENNPADQIGSEENDLLENSESIFALARSYTEEELQEVRERPIKYGEMSLFWWAVMCGKITASTVEASSSLAVTEDNSDPTVDEDLQAAADSETDAAPIEGDDTPLTESSAPQETETDSDSSEDENLLAASYSMAESTASNSESAGDESRLTFSDTTAESTATDTEPAGDVSLLAASDTSAESTAPDSESAGDENLLAAGDTTAEGTAPDSESTGDESALLEDGSPSGDTQTESEQMTSDSVLVEGAENGESGISVLAASSDPTYDDDISINNAEDLIYLSYVNPSEYQNKKIQFYNTGASTLNLTKSIDGVLDESSTPVSFQGLGSAPFPYSGEWNYPEGSESTALLLNRPLFNALSGSASFTFGIGDNSEYPVILKWDGSSKTAVLADQVIQAGRSTWYIRLEDPADDAQTENVLVPVIGTMAEGSSVSLKVVVADGYSPVVKGSGFLCGTMNAGATLTAVRMSKTPAVENASGNAGGLVGTMESNSTLIVTGTETLALSAVTATGGNAGGLAGEMQAGAKVELPEGVTALTLPAVTATDGNAGGLAGQMDAGASVNVTAILTLADITASGSDKEGNAGGLAGYAKDPGALTLLSITGPATISGKKAGGLFGWLQNSANTTFSLKNSISDITLSGSDSAGGLFGELHNDKEDAEDAIAYLISKSDTGSISNITLTSKDAGGLIGKYYTDDLKNTLTVKDITVSSAASSATSYGGVIGNVESGVPAYVEFSNVTTTTSGNVTSYGGLIGSLRDSGHMVKVGAGVSVSGDFKGTNVGGLVGSMPSGVLYIANDPEGTNSFPELSLKKLTENVAATRGWILGNRGNTLVYTDIPNWSQLPSKSSADKESNDTGVWGQVLRVDGALSTLLTPNETEHTVTVKAPTFQDENTALNNSAKVTSVLDFAAVALRLQLNEVTSGALRFDGGDFDKKVKIAITLDSTITNPIDLNDTGLTGFTRDVNSTEVFNLTINGNDKTITLPDLKVYTSSNGHDRQGLIGKASELTMENLTVDGVVTSHSLAKFYAGGILAEATGAFALNSVTSSVAMTIDGGGNDDCAFSGFVGSTTKDCKGMTFSNCTYDGSITDNTGKNPYIGGMLAYANNNEANDKSSFTVSANNCSISDAAITVSTAPSNYARVGGLFASLYYGNYTLTISDLSVSGLNISVPKIASGNIPKDTINPKFCGGLLGCEWMNTTATISGVTITGCTLVAGAVPFGGLVYKSSGHWNVQSTTVGEGESATTTPGIHFSGTNTFTGGSPNDFPSGLLVSRGDNILNSNGTIRGALYMEIGEGAYKIDTNSVSVTLNNGTYFDEIVGITKGSYGNGIVSIGTAADNDGNKLIDQNGCNTYQKQLSTDYDNPNTRYYYNLDTFRTQVQGDIDTPEEMVVLSARGHCHSGLLTYFPLGSNKICSDGLNLSGYSYYPIPFSGQSISNATITFDYEGLETAESASTTDEGTIPENKKPSNADRQHYGMHTGIFTDVGSASAKASLTIDGLTLKGTVGGSSIINDKAEGKAVDALTVLDFKNINLDGIRTPSDALKPLLIQDIGNYTTLKMDGVTTIGTEYAGFQRDAEGISIAFNAATSLIGNVGSETATDIKLEFLNIKLDGRETNGSETRHNTCRTIFSEALFLQDFQYPDGSPCQGTYNFTDDENHGYTLGQELSNTSGENSRNNKEQYCFFRTSDYVCKAEFGEDSDPATAFAGGYLRYVKNHEGSPNVTHHEMDINLSKPDLTEGCGTYSDPYLIRDGKQLQAVANALQNSGTVDGWTINLNVGNQGVLIDSGSYGPQNGHTKDDAENPDGDWKDLQYTRVGGVWKAVVEETNNSEPAEPETGTSTATPPEFADSDILLYLRNAYYKIENDIELPTDWAGLGEPTTSQAFSGVIVGKSGENNVQVTVKTSSSLYRFGGLIKYSQGSVVKDLDIHYESAPAITCSVIPSTLGNASFFGGVIGWCMGGDNIIDNVTVTYRENVAPSVTGGNSYLAAVGGYVGLVGGTEGSGTTSDGLGGGVVFRNFSVDPLSSEKFDKVADSSKYFYVNPYVGRVLDGYALSEGRKLENTDKNYQIPGISSIPSHLEMTGSQVTVNDADGLWLLSAIANSGAGNAASCKAYTSGKARTCDYSKVGQSSADGDRADETDGTDVYLGGDANYSKPTSYLTSGLSSGLSALTGGSAVSIVLSGEATSFDMSTYGNGFRGIGGSYGTTSSNRMPTVSSVTSKDGTKTVSLGQNRKEYSAESEKWTTIATGLFTVLNPADNLTVSNLFLEGKTGITYYGSNGTEGFNPIPGDRKLMGVTNSVNGTNIVYRLGYSGAGLLAGSLITKASNITSITVENISLSGSVNGSATFAGGLIGLACINNDPTYKISSFTVENCSYTNLNVSGHACVGGFLGYVSATTLSITATSTITLSGGTIASQSVAINGAKTGVGGLIGRCDTTNLTIGGNTEEKMVFSASLNVTNNNSTGDSDKFFTGGLAGLLGMHNNGKVNIQNISITGKVAISNSTKANNSSGALAGALAYYGESNKTDLTSLFGNTEFDWGKGGNVQATIANIQIATQENGSVTITNTKQGGVLFGFMMVSKAETVQNIHIGSENSKVTIATETPSGSASLSGLIGTLSVANPLNLSDVSLERVNVWANPKDNNRGTALLVGFADNNAVCNFNNVKMKDCNVAVGRDGARAGFLYGDYSGSSISGSNILIDGCSVGLSLNDSNKVTAFTAESEEPYKIGLKINNSFIPYSDLTANNFDNYNGSNIGIFGGYANGKNVKLVGVSLQGCSTPAKDFAETSGTKYAIRADYAGAATGVASNVTVKPDLDLPGIGTITSDGVAFSSDATTPLAQRIVENYLDTANVPRCQVYFNATDAMDYFCSTTGDSKAVNTSYFSTFNTAGENSIAGVTDFPVLVINSTEAKKADIIVKNYIALLTNAPASLSKSISARAYKWDADQSKFVVNSDDPSLTATNKTISVITNKYDNQKGQFTLLDVQYADPADSSKIAYHLYIPVIVKKVLEYKFHASAKNGTTYSPSEYNGTTQVIATHGEQITALLTFEYLRTKEQWQLAVDNGDNLLWNFDKEIKFDGTGLPAGTMLTLVDRNDQSKAYFCIASGKEVKFSAFKLNDPNAGQPWSHSNVRLCDLLKLKVVTEESLSTSKVKFVEANETNATVQVEGQYYRPAGADEAGTCYINVGISGNVTEEYYLTIQTPKTTTGITNSDIACSKLTPPEGIVQPTKLVNWSGNKQYSTGNENHITLGNFFKQTLKVSAPGDPLISESNHSITAVLTAEISFVEEYFTLFKGYADKLTLFQRFTLHLQEHEKDASKSVAFANGTQISASYSDGTTKKAVTADGVFSFPMEISRFSFNNNVEASLKYTKTATVTLTYDPEAIIQQFPEAKLEDNHGICIHAESSLAYSEAVLDYSSMRISDADTDNRYYREDSSLASLSYNVDTSAVGHKQLGINGREGTNFTVHSLGIYDISALSNASAASQLQFTVKLYQKDNDGNYKNEVSIREALQGTDGLTITPSVYTGSGYVSLGSGTPGENGVCSFIWNGSYNSDVPIKVGVDLKVNTGSPFEGTDLIYANYKVVLTAELLNGGTLIEGSHASDFIIYTNAKIRFDMIS